MENTELENSAVDELSQPQEQTDKKSEKSKLPFLFDSVSILISAIFAIVVIFTFLFRFAGVVGPSMQPTLYENDWLIVDTAESSYHRGDIIISTQPNAFNEPIVKRVIASGGQTVKIDFETGSVYVDGEKLDEPYVQGETTNSEGFSGSVEVPEGKLFVMGDNRLHSTDSRSSAIGLLDERYIIGKVKVRFLPFDSFKVFD